MNEINSKWNHSSFQEYQAEQFNWGPSLDQKGINTVCFLVPAHHSQLPFGFSAWIYKYSPESESRTDFYEIF